MVKVDLTKKPYFLEKLCTFQIKRVILHRIFTLAK